MIPRTWTTAELRVLSSRLGRPPHDQVTIDQAKAALLVAADFVIAESNKHIEALEADKARLIEDRARFPDRPDDIGAMIGGHFSNLKTVAKTNEDAWRRAQAVADAAAANAERYEHVRTLSPKAFADICRRNLADEGSFDGLIDQDIEMRAEAAAMASAAQEG